ncbi:hypothetical protein PFHG_05384 [Plasmodium falciparum HB3]|uniref:Dynamin N-terminal domain-containing protein n=1 Tax=Plasmodium falciparum (isolate HB3) TaxID=137071 RepID=A0A0L7KL07_PLAFX|nr:hypothetical protein PFHG_05384 [Plasmodium falciparum HB3]
MESMPSETTINSEQYKSKESNNICRNEKSTAYSENSDISNNKEDYNSDRKENFDKKLCDNMNDKINIYDNIISEIKELYNGNIVMNNKGLDKLNIRNVAKGLFLNINKTISKKVRVLVIGNSSSGKSTFINWFLQENIQKTGYEYETNNFTLITSGNYFSEFNGDITVRTFDFLKQISNRNRNFKNNLCTKMYVSKNMETKNIDFIDTPGLKDIMNKLDFDINSIIYDLSDYVDIILVFFDSSGKSLSNRLLLIIKEIYEKHMEKIIFIFSKIDEIKHEEDRIKLLSKTYRYTSFSLFGSHFNFGNNSVYIKYIKNTGVMLNNWENSYIMINVILVFFFLLSGIMKKKFSKNIKTLHVSSKEILREQLTFAKFAKDRGKYLAKTFYELKQT